MNQVIANGIARGESFFLGEVLGGRVMLRDRKVGKLQDVVAVDRGKLAEVTHIQVSRPFGSASVLVPLANVRIFHRGEVVIEVDNLDSYARPLAVEEVLLKDYLLDKKVIDVEDRDVEVVYDIRLVHIGDRLYVSDVDISRYGLLRQLGLKSLAEHLYKRADDANKQLIPWSYIEPLPSDLGALKGNVKLSVLKEKLAEIHPADLADILEELDSPQRVKLMQELDVEHASDTLEEVDPAVQRDIVFCLPKQRVAQLIADMTPGQAADVIQVLPAEEKRSILKLLDPAQVTKIEEILEKQDFNILNFTTLNFLKFSPETTVGEARIVFRERARDMDEVMYFYVLDERCKLLGVTNLEDIFMADDNQRLKDLMLKNVISLGPQSTMKEAVSLFQRYSFRALPVVDANETILGIVPYRDVMQLKHRILE
jgi:CBS domain-containing protein